MVRRDFANCYKKHFLLQMFVIHGICTPNSSFSNRDKSRIWLLSRFFEIFRFKSRFPRFFVSNREIRVIRKIPDTGLQDYFSVALLYPQLL